MKNNEISLWYRSCAYMYWFGRAGSATITGGYAMFRKLIATFVNVIGLTVAAVSPVAAVPLPGSLWYNGDFDGDDALANERNTVVTDSAVYDNFIIPATDGSWNITSVYSNNLVQIIAPFVAADFEIRTGVSSGNGGTLVASGTDLPVIMTPTGNSGFGTPEFTVQIIGLSLNLAPDQYWLMVRPVDSGSGRSFVSTTSGANAVGTPPGNDGNSFIDSTFFGVIFAPTTVFISGWPDFSMGVIGTTQVTISEPNSLLLIGTVILGLFGYGWRRRRLV